MKDIIRNVKSGWFAVYKGKEYRIITKDEEWILIDEDPQSIRQGFIKRKNPQSKLYEKKIDVSEIESYYYIWKKAIYENQEYSFYPEDDEKLLLLTYDESVVRKYGLAKVFGRNEFGFFAPIKDITFKEIKEKEKINGVQWWSDDEPIKTYITYKL